MEYRQYDNGYERYLECRYYLPDGRQKIRRAYANTAAMMEQGQSQALEAHLKHRMEREALADIRENIEQPLQGEGMVHYTTTGTADIAYPGYYQLPTQIYNDFGTSCHPNYTLTTASTDTVCVPNQYWAEQNIQYVKSQPDKIRIRYKEGKKELVIEKELAADMEITPEDIAKARVGYYKSMKLTILTRKADERAENLLKMMVSEVDFRNFKEKGFFTVRMGNKVYRIHKDKSRFIDAYEQENGILVPKNRLCVHTERRNLPEADECLTKLMLIRSKKVEEHSNLHDIGSLKPVNRIEELIAA